MNIDPGRYQEMSRRQILREFIDHVSSTEETQKEKDHRSGRTTDVNLYLLDNRGYQVGCLDEYINNITENPDIRSHAKNYVKKHTFDEEVINHNTSVIYITTPKKERTDECVWLLHDEYVWVLTTERQEWRKSIENLIKYLPQVDRLYLSSEYLENLTSDDTIDDAIISGFTAEYHTPYAERQATLRFHGGQKKDLDKAREYFNATPTRIEFDQANSPAVAIEGATTNTGRLSLQSVVNGSQEKAVDTIMAISGNYQEIDKKSFEVEYRSRHSGVENGFIIDGFTAIELTDPERNSDQEDDEVLLIDLEKNVLNSNQYQYALRDETTVRVYDTYHDELFDLALEPPDIIIYPRESATAHSLRDIVQDIYEYDSTYSHKKIENGIGIQ